jgi:hypothetical protein
MACPEISHSALLPCSATSDNTQRQTPPGFVPRAQDHFGRGYVAQTRAALDAFAARGSVAWQVPPRVLAVQQARAARAEERRQQQAESFSSSASDTAGKGLPALPPVSRAESKARAAAAQAAPGAGDERRRLMGGYTGFVPCMRERFGVNYAVATRTALHDFRHSQEHATAPGPGGAAALSDAGSVRQSFTRSVGKARASMPGGAPGRQVPPGGGEMLPIKRLAASLPIAGYGGHLPEYATSADHPFMVSSRLCIRRFEELRARPGY